MILLCFQEMTTTGKANAASGDDLCLSVFERLDLKKDAAIKTLEQGYKELKKLYDEDQKLKESGQLRRMTNDEAHLTYIKDRIVDLNYLGEHGGFFIWNLYRKRPTVIAGRVCPTSHPDKDKLTSRLKELSLLMSNKYKEKYGVPPPIDKSRRTNAYVAMDYQEFGDDVIKTYMESNPLKVEVDTTGDAKNLPYVVRGWDIQWDFNMTTEEFQDMLQKGLAALVNPQIECGCGAVFAKANTKRHEKTQRHVSWLQNKTS